MITVNIAKLYSLGVFCANPRVSRAFRAVTAKTLRSQSHNSPYLGREMQGGYAHYRYCGGAGNLRGIECLEEIVNTVVYNILALAKNWVTQRVHAELLVRL